MRVIDKLNSILGDETQVESTEALNQGKKGWDALGDSKVSSAQSEWYCPEVEGYVPLSPVAEKLHISADLRIKVRKNIQIEQCVYSEKSGAWKSWGLGVTQSYAATHIFVRCTTKEAANQRLVRVAMLLALEKFLSSNPEGGEWEFKGSHFFIRKIKTDEPEEEVEADIEL